MWEKVINPNNNVHRVGQYRERTARWQGVISCIEKPIFPYECPDISLKIHVKAFYAGVPINKIFHPHHPLI